MRRRRRLVSLAALDIGLVGVCVLVLAVVAVLADRQVDVPGVSAMRLRASLEKLGREQSQLVDPSVDESPYGSGTYVLSAGLAEGTGTDDAVAVYEDVLSRAGDEDAVSDFDGGVGLDLRWDVGSTGVVLVAGLRAPETGTVRAGLTMASAAAQDGASHVKVDTMMVTPVVEASWDDAQPGDLSAVRPGQGGHPAVDAITYVQSGYVDDVLVTVRVEPGAEGLAQAGIGAWASAAGEAGASEVWLGASANGVKRSFRFQHATSIADLEKAAPPLLAAVDQCSVDTTTELEVDRMGHRREPRLEYACQDGRLVVAPASPDEQEQEAADPQAARRALEAARSRDA